MLVKINENTMIRKYFDDKTSNILKKPLITCNVTNLNSFVYSSDQTSKV